MRRISRTECCGTRDSVLAGRVSRLPLKVGALVLGVSDRQRLPLLLAGLLAIGHSFATARAAPINLGQRSAAGDEAALKHSFDRFERWQTARAILQLATFLVMLWALASAAAASSGSD